MLTVFLISTLYVQFSAIMTEESVLQLFPDFRELEASIEESSSTIKKLQKELSSITKSVVYIRWGRTSCPSGAKSLYSGYAGGSYYGHNGAAVNPLCLPRDPQYSLYRSGHQGYRNYIYGAEYERLEDHQFRGQHNYDVPCVVCRVTGKSSVIVLPARRTCYSGARQEYSGYLMAGKFDFSAASMFTCVDENPETISGTSADLNGYLFYSVEGRCGSLPCGPYSDGKEITCVVCSYD